MTLNCSILRLRLCFDYFAANKSKQCCLLQNAFSLHLDMCGWIMMRCWSCTVTLAVIFNTSISALSFSGATSLQWFLCMCTDLHVCVWSNSEASYLSIKVWAKRGYHILPRNWDKHTFLLCPSPSLPHSLSLKPLSIFVPLCLNHCFFCLKSPSLSLHLLSWILCH